MLANSRLAQAMIKTCRLATYSLIGLHHWHYYPIVELIGCVGVRRPYVGKPKFEHLNPRSSQRTQTAEPELRVHFQTNHPRAAPQKPHAARAARKVWSVMTRRAGLCCLPNGMDFRRSRRCGQCLAHPTFCSRI